MATIYKVDCPNRKPLFEGVQGENEARSIQFDITAWVEELGAGAVTATAKRPTDAQPYPVTIEQDGGNIVTWKPTSTDTAFEGVGSFQLEYTVDDVLAKTCIWSTQIAPSLDPAGDPPDPYDNWLASMREVAAAAQQSANDSAASAQQAAGEVTNAQTEVKNAEAWAVGTRGGVDVPSTDEAYHNNAKYWAGQAENLKDGTQTIVDEARADVFEAMDGMHEETTAGSALQLISDKYTEDKVPYLFRKSGGGKSIGNREFDTLVGGSVAWNQLVESGDTSVTVPNTHKYLSKINSARSIGISNGSAIAINDSTEDNVHDLTAMFGTAVADRLYQMEQAQAGSGVALFRSWFSKEYYAYNAGEIMSVKTNAHEMVGKNQFDKNAKNTSNGYHAGRWIRGVDAQESNDANYNISEYIPVLPNTQYTISGTYGTNPGICFYDENKQFVSGIGYGAAIANPVRTFTTPSGVSYARFSIVNAMVDEMQLEIGETKTAYESYTKHTYALDDIELRGVPKLVDGEIQYDGDTYEADGTVTRKYGTRAYQSGDEDNASYITDKTTTIYPLTTPTTETADPFTSPQIVDAYGTERYVDERTVAVPVGHITKYPDNLRDKLDGLPWDFSSLIAPTEKAYTATRNYTAGSLLIVNNILYKVTANIANGGAITPNTNVTATTLSEVISAL